MANRQQDVHRPHGRGQYDDYNENNEGGARYGRDTDERSGSTGRYPGYGDWGQGDYDRTGRGANTGQNRYGMTGFGGGDSSDDYGRGNYGREEQRYGREYGSSGTSRYGRSDHSGGGDFTSRDYGGNNYGSGRRERDDSQRSGYGTDGSGGSRRGTGSYAGSGASSGYGYGGHGIESQRRGREWNEPFGESHYGAGPGLHRGKGPKGYQRSDERLKEMISERLRDDPYIDATEVTVTCQAGKLTLDGMVDSRQSKNAIEDIAEQLGVSDVQNNLRVQRAWQAGSESQSQARLTGSGDEPDSMSKQRKN